MNIRDLMLKLDTIAEAEAPVVDPARAQYDKFKSDDAKAGAIAQVKKMLAPNGMQNFIDPKDGIVKWQEQMQGDSGGAGSVREFPFDWYKKGQNSDFFNILKTAGLEIVPVDRKMLFGTSQVAGIKGGPQALADLDKPVVAPTPAPGPVTKPEAKGNDDAAKLEVLVAQLEATLKGEGPMPTPDTTVPTDVTKKEKEKTLGQQAGIGAGIGAGALAGGALGKKYGGAKGAALGALTGGALGGLGVNALQKEGTELSMAQALTESFGYDFETEQLDEYSMSQLGQDAGDFGRGAWNGITLGTGDNIAAGVKSALGPGTYKDELAKQTAASKEAETRSPWLYGAGNVAGSIAVPVPGGAIAGGLIKGASTAAKVARGATALGTNLAAQAGIDKVKQASDAKTLGYDPTKYPKTPQEIMAFQKANGLTPDGKIGPKTSAVLAKMGLTPTTVAEDIKSLKDRLAMIESGQWRLEEDADYRVWLLEDGTVVGEQGEVITDESILSEVNWGALAGDAWKGIKGVGSNFAGGLSGKAVQGTAKTADEIAAMQAARTAAGKKALHPSQITNLGLDTKMPSKAQSMANTLGQKIHMNPGKAALGAAALGAGGMAALSGGAGASPTGTTTGGGGTGGGGTGGGGDTPATTTPAGGLTPEQQELIKQIKALALQHGEDESPEWAKATGHMQVVLDKAEKTSPEQVASDAKNDAKTTTAAAPTTTGAPATSGQAASPTGTTKEGLEESDELTRWLKIARG